MKLTVIVPVYNVEKYLERCLDSIVNQTFVNLEIIVVNDGSSDGSLDIIKKYADKDSRINYISQENQGLSAARNAGISASTGDYITFVDSDDWLEKDIYEHIFNLILERNDTIDIVHYNIVRNYENEENALLNQEPAEIVCYEGEDIMRKFFCLKGNIHGFSSCTKIYRRESIMGLKFPVGRTSEDILFNYYAYCRAKTCLETTKIGYHYFERKGSITCGKLNKKSFDCVELWQEIDTLITDKTYKKVIRNFMIKNNFILLLRATTYGVREDFVDFPQVKKKALKQFRKDIFALLRMKNLKKGRKLAALIMFVNYSLCGIIARMYLK